MLVALFTGGSARDDVPGLIVLRPFAALCLTVAVLTMTRDVLREHRAALILAGAWIALIALHLVPLPPAVWMSLPGRELAVEAGVAAGIGQPWRPIALVPWRAWNAFFAALVPLAALLLAVQLTPRQRQWLGIAALAIGMASAAIAFLQLLAPGRGLFYLYRFTSSNLPVGLMANRNHQAALLASMLPILAAVASDPETFRPRGRRIAALALGVFFAFMAVMTGSRGGLAAVVVGLIAAALIYRTPPSRRSPQIAVEGRTRWLVWAGGGMLVAALVGFALWRSTVLARVATTPGSGETRFEIWGPIAEMVRTYLPFGSGFGSFVEVYAIGEPLALLDTSYTNHAHNDLLELALEGGLPALALLLVAILAWGRRAIGLFAGGVRDSQEARTAAAGAAIVLVLGLASVVDYPVRTPLVAIILAIGAAWLGKPDGQGVGSPKR
jgi:O-antigen ligase